MLLFWAGAARCYGLRHSSCFPADNYGTHFLDVQWNKRCVQPNDDPAQKPEGGDDPKLFQEDHLEEYENARGNVCEDQALSSGQFFEDERGKVGPERRAQRHRGREHSDFP